MAAGTETETLPLFLPSFPEELRPLILSAKHGLDIVRNDDDGSVNRSLMSRLVPDVPATPVPVDGVSSSDHDVDPARGTWVRIFTPDEGIHQRPLPVVVFFHGGGFAFYSPASQMYDTLCRRMAREVGAVVVSVAYRLAPEHRYPAAYDDGFDALRLGV